MYCFLILILIYVDIKNIQVSMWLRGYDHSQTIQDPDICGHKQKTCLYMDIKTPIQNLENPDLYGHKQQKSLKVDIEHLIQG